MFEIAPYCGADTMGKLPSGNAWIRPHQSLRPNRRSVIRSRREAFVAMVQPADLWNGNDSTVQRRLDRSRVRAVFVQ